MQKREKFIHSNVHYRAVELGGERPASGFLAQDENPGDWKLQMSCFPNHSKIQIADPLVEI